MAGFGALTLPAVLPLVPLEVAGCGVPRPGSASSVPQSACTHAVDVPPAPLISSPVRIGLWQCAQRPGNLASTVLLVYRSTCGRVNDLHGSSIRSDEQA